MAHAYTPGLRVTPWTTIHRQRRLPLKGNVLVEIGAQVRRDEIVARTALPGNVTALNLVNRLGVTPEELPGYMIVGQGDSIQAGDPIAATKPLIKWFKTTIESPVSGIVESVSSVTGQVILRQRPRPVEVLAYVDGVVVDVFPEEGVLVETSGAFVQGIFGVGGECWGPLHLVASAPDETLDAANIGAECRGKIVVGGGMVTSSAFARAREVGAAGVIGGGIRDQDLRDLLGYDLGVAITGAEEIGLTVIVTEGFGEIAMAHKTFDILQACSGKEASISGATQIRAGVVRPEIIVSDLRGAGEADERSGQQEKGIQEGDFLRVIRAPDFGRIGRVRSLPAELVEVGSGARVRVLEMEFEDSSRLLVPRANVEAIEG